MDLPKLSDLETEALDIKLFQIAGTDITLATVAIFALIIVSTYVLSLLLQRALVRGFKMRGVTDEGTVAVTRRLSHYAVLVIGFGVGLQTVGINLSALFAAGAVFAIGLGFAMQTLAQNFVAGLLLLLEGSIKPGHVLQVENRLVRVRRMTIRSTVVRTLDEEDIIVPNSILVQSSVINYTLEDSHYRLRCPVGVIYGADMRAVQRVLTEAARAMPWRNHTFEPVILLTDFGSSSVDWEVSVWIDDPWKMRRLRSELNHAIWWALQEAGIPIAFPQLDVHFDPPVMEAVGRYRDAS